MDDKNNENLHSDAKCIANSYVRDITFKLSIKLALSSSLFNRVKVSLRKKTSSQLLPIPHFAQGQLPSLKSNMYNRMHFS